MGTTSNGLPGVLEANALPTNARARACSSVSPLGCFPPARPAGALGAHNGRARWAVTASVILANTVALFGNPPCLTHKDSTAKVPITLHWASNLRRGHSPGWSLARGNSRAATRAASVAAPHARITSVRGRPSSPSTDACRVNSPASDKRIMIW